MEFFEGGISENLKKKKNQPAKKNKKQSVQLNTIFKKNFHNARTQKIPKHNLIVTPHVNRVSWSLQMAAISISLNHTEYYTRTQVQQW